jgi:hypothetical protein
MPHDNICWLFSPHTDGHYGVISHILKNKLYPDFYLNEFDASGTIWKDDI